MNYTITWKYIVERMKSKYGFAPDNTEQLSMGELERYIQDIWEEFFEKKYEEYNKYCEDVSEGCVKYNDLENTH